MIDTTTDMTTSTTTVINEPMGKNGYVSLKLAKEDAALVQEQLDRAGIKDAIPADKLHCTLFYAKKGLPDTLKAAGGQVHVAFVRPNPMIIGEEPWRALVLELDCPSLGLRHEEIKQSTGGEHSYPDYLPHMSLKYGPVEGDAEKIGNALAGMTLRLTDETIEDIKENP